MSPNGIVHVSRSGSQLTLIGRHRRARRSTVGDSAGGAPQSFAVTVLPPAPTATGSIEAATIRRGRYARSDRLGLLRGGRASRTWRSAEVATAAVNGAPVTVTAVGAGSARVTVTATNSGGSAEQAFAVTVLPPAPATVAASGRDGARSVTASDYSASERDARSRIAFGERGHVRWAESSDSRGRRRWRWTARRYAHGDGGRRRRGATAVTVTATNGDCGRRERGAVVRRHGAAARAGEGRSAASRRRRSPRAGRTVIASDYFAGEGITYGAESRTARSRRWRWTARR